MMTVSLILRCYWIPYLLKHSPKFRQFVFDDKDSRDSVKNALEFIHKKDLDSLKKDKLFQNLEENRTKIDMLYFSQQTLLTAAVYREDMKIIKYLVEEAKVNINAQTKNGETALHRAASCRNPAPLEYLLKQPGI